MPELRQKNLDHFGQFIHGFLKRRSPRSYYKTEGKMEYCTVFYLDSKMNFIENSKMGYIMRVTEIWKHNVGQVGGCTIVCVADLPKGKYYLRWVQRVSADNVALPQSLKKLSWAKLVLESQFEPISSLVAK